MFLLLVMESSSDLPSLESFPAFSDDDEGCGPLPVLPQLVDLTSDGEPCDCAPPSQHDSTLSFIDFDLISE